MTPKALTKHAAASALVSASSAAPIGISSFIIGCGSEGESRKAWKVSHSETKPLKGGSAEIETAPTRKSAAVQGIRWIRPPIRSMFRSPVACSTAPAPMKSSPLNRAWLSAW